MNILCKKHIRRALAIIAFAVLLFVGDRGGAALLRRFVGMSQVRFSCVYSGQATDDILIIGNSRGVNGIYAPWIENNLGLKAFNLSYNGMGMQLSEALFLDYLEHNSSPRLLVVEITNLNVGENLVNNLKLYQGNSPRLAHLLRKMNPQNYWACQLSHLYRYNCELMLRSAYFLRRTDQTWINRYRIDPVMAQDYTPAPGDLGAFSKRLSDGSWAQLAPESVMALRHMLEVANARGIEVHLYISPYLPRYIETHHEDFERWRHTVEAELGPSHPIWDFSGAIRDVSMFADPLHMNIDGADVLMPMLAAKGFFNISCE